MAQNSFAPQDASDFDVVFFREDFSGTVGSRRTISYKQLDAWAQLQAATRATPIVVGVYLPFLGSALYDVLVRMRVGFSSIAQALPARMQEIAGKGLISQVCIPALMFLVAEQERWQWSTDGSDEEERGAFDANVPYARLMEQPVASNADLLHPQPRVQTPDAEQQGYLHFDAPRMGDVPFRRVPFELQGADLVRISPRELASAINALGIRVYVSVPLALLRAPPGSYEQEDWKGELLRVARDVAEMQGTPILAIGTRVDEDTWANLPPDVLRVSPGEPANSVNAWTFVNSSGV